MTRETEEPPRSEPRKPLKEKVEALEETVRELEDERKQQLERAQELLHAKNRAEEAKRRLVDEQASRLLSEKLSSIGMLAAGVAHEINNPLAGIMSCIKSLRDGNVEGARRDEYFDAVWDGLARIRETVQSLLDFARVQPEHYAEVDVAHILSSCLTLLASRLRDSRITIDTTIEPGDCVVVADRAQLMQATMNVLLNAIYASPEHERVRVNQAHRVGRRGISFRDRGTGIAAEDLPHVCDPFFTTKPEGHGTGLGMATTRSILNSLGGELEITSDGASGTTVTFWIPERPAEDE